MDIDKLDKAILNILQEDARIPISKIAKKVNAPQTTVYERVAKLEKSGVISKYVTLLNPDKVGKGFTAFLLGQAKLGEDTDLDEVGKRLASLPAVQEAHFITGEWDYILKLRVKDQKEYYSVVKDIAKTLLSRGSGMIVPKSFKEKTSFDL